MSNGSGELITSFQKIEICSGIRDCSEGTMCPKHKAWNELWLAFFFFFSKKKKMWRNKSPKIFE